MDVENINSLLENLKTIMTNIEIGGIYYENEVNF